MSTLGIWGHFVVSQSRCSVTSQNDGILNNTTEKTSKFARSRFLCGCRRYCHFSLPSPNTLTLPHSSSVYRLHSSFHAVFHCSAVLHTEFSCVSCIQTKLLSPNGLYFIFILFKFHPVFYHFQLRKNIWCFALHSNPLTFFDSHSVFYGTIQTQGKQHAITFYVGEECLV